MSVLPPFTYPNLSPRSHGVITVFCYLQIFLCPMNEDMTRVHRVVALEMETSGTPMTFDMALHRHEAFDKEVTLGAISHCAEGPPP
jgi:hypothetical protein